MLRTHPRQPHALRQYGGAGQILLRWDQRLIGVRRLGGQARCCVHFHSDTAWRTGVDAAVHDDSTPASRHVFGRASIHRNRPDRHPQRRHALRCEPRGGPERPRRIVGHRVRAGSFARPPRGPARRSTTERRVSMEATARSLTIWLWIAVALSLLAWTLVGYPWPICVLAVLPLLAPLNGLIRGRRHTYAWATLFAIPYLAFAITELLANPEARWVAGLSLLLVFGWFCTMILFLRASRARRE